MNQHTEIRTVDRVAENDGSTLAECISYHLHYSRAVTPETATKNDFAFAVGLAVRDRLIDAMASSEQAHLKAGSKRVHYISMEFLIGRLLENNIINLQIRDECQAALKLLGQDIEWLFDTEYDPALGNGGLGRLAACFIDSIATLGIAGYGYGINYEYGLFKQSFTNGYQHEAPDHWMIEGTPWLVERQNERVLVPLFGRVETIFGRDGEEIPSWVDWDLVIGVPYDKPVVGYGGQTVNYVRLYSAQSSDEFDIGIFNDGDYLRAMEKKVGAEKISKILYPEDSSDAGKELRLVQEYFLVSCSVQDIVRRHVEQHRDIGTFAEKQAIQLNDTHPALTVAELMRVLIDERSLSFDDAWAITGKACAYTNHTLLPEALETWPADLMERVLPRHMQIIREIERRFLILLEERFPGDKGKHDYMRILGADGAGRPEAIVRMANLSMVGSHSVNGVAALHSELVKTNLAPDFYALWPDKFNNKTNGVTPRRWILQSNPGLSKIVSDAIGEGWITDLDQMRRLEEFTDDGAFVEKIGTAKRENKTVLSNLLKQRLGVSLNPASMFDIQAKRMHEYKRQLLNALHIAHLYLSITEQDLQLAAPRTYLFGGKAAPGYFMAKRIIKFINTLGTAIEAHPKAREQLQVCFIPDYKVSVAERLIPAADLSEQISTAGFEASGTGNMKFAMNGALTVGTLDGANVEMLEEIGADNMYIFGMTTEEVAATRPPGAYDAQAIYNGYAPLKRVIDSLTDGTFCPEEPDVFEPIAYSLMTGGDYFRVLGDFQAYVEIQETIGNDFTDSAEWNRKCLLNIARMGKFSSDRSIADYARDIWQVEGFA